MRPHHRRGILLPLIVLAALTATTPALADIENRWPSAVVADPGQASRREMLVSHGIRPLPEDLIRFLREGFPAPAPGQQPNLPREPRRKIDVVDAAIQEMGLTAERSAVPVLLEIAARTGPGGVSSVLRRDVEDLPIEAADTQVALARRVLSLNAVVALGLIGDTSAEPAILNLMRTETGSAFVTRGAEALGLMGSSAGMASLVMLASQPDNEDSVAAFRSVFVLTGRNYGYTTNTPLARRRELISELRIWSETPEAAVPPQRADVLRRLDTPPLATPVDPTSLRGLLRASVTLGANTREEFDTRFEARRTLDRITRERYDELRAIAEDTREELDIRRAAIRWLAVANPRKARSIVRAQKKDENPSIAEVARVVEQDIPDYIEEEKLRDQ
jgi:hypothetical protein